MSTLITSSGRGCRCRCRGDHRPERRHLPRRDHPRQADERHPANKPSKNCASMTGIRIPGDDETRANRIAGLGPLTGLAAGIGSGLLLSLICTAGGSQPPATHRSV